MNQIIKCSGSLEELRGARIVDMCRIVQLQPKGQSEEWLHIMYVPKRCRKLRILKIKSSADMDITVNAKEEY